ncbi:MAG: grasp-with-spasm system SPASM domain peptide maturase [Cytophagales bacterium]|nr:MAG: grasp-with-spasm system SPASM domain peptide maturase [Cytophagales bacterium]
MNKYFKLFACCILVKGFTRSLICDIQRGIYHFIPNDLFDILNDNKDEEIEDISELYGLDNKMIIYDYFKFMVDNEYGFLVNNKDELDNFPPLDTTFNNPFIITNIIIDVNKNINFHFTNLVEQLEMLGCVDIQIRFFREVDIEYIKNIFDIIENKRIKSLNIIVKYDQEVFLDEYVNLSRKYLRISNITIHSSPFNKRIDNGLNNNTFIDYTMQMVTDSSHCGIIHQNNFILNIPTFTESQHHNTCLNRKISIDVNGEIKNCPSMTKSYGNIKDTTLAEALAKEGFKDMWHIKKDQIKVCQDCEFRHICTDCRAHLGSRKSN